MEKQLRAAVAGLGVFGEMEAGILSELPNVRLEGLCSKSEKRLTELGDRFRVAKRYRKFEDLSRDRDIDAVFIATDAKEHAEQAFQAMDAGKAVFLEKPMTLNYEDAEKLVKKSESAGTFLMVGFENRFGIENGAIKRAIDEGKFGTLLYMTSRIGISRAYFTATSGYSYFHPVHETMSHHIDLALWFAGSRTVKRVYARDIFHYAKERPDACLAMLTFSDGMVATFETNWVVPDGAPRNHWKYGRTMDVELEVVGSTMIAKSNLIGGNLLMWNSEGVLAPEVSWWPEAHGHVGGALRNEIVHFVDCVVRGVPSTVGSLKDALYGTILADRIIESASSGREVTL
jgi:predicted dehydrogenase